MTAERDRLRLANVQVGLVGAYFTVAEKFAATFHGCSLTVPPNGGYRTPFEQSTVHQGGASGYNGTSSFSKHQSFPARAFDFMVIDNGQLVVDGHDVRYAWVGVQMTLLGYRWGGYFKRPDWDHVEAPGPEPTFEEVRAGFEDFKKTIQVTG